VNHIALSSTRCGHPRPPPSPPQLRPSPPASLGLGGRIPPVAAVAAEQEPGGNRAEGRLEVAVLAFEVEEYSDERMMVHQAVRSISWRGLRDEPGDERLDLELRAEGVPVSEDRRTNLAYMASRLIHSGTAAATAAPRPATGNDLP